MPATRPRPPKPFVDVLKRAEGAGYKRAFVTKTVLPDWWEDNIAATPAGLEEAVGYLALRLSLSAPSLRAGETAERVSQGDAKFKMREGVEVSDLEPAKSVAAWALRLACRAVKVPSRDVPTAAALRSAVLGSGAPWVDFEHVLDACWSHGIPVLPVGDPGGRKKMDGMAARFGDRFGITLCGAYSSPSKQAFILAHELGHVASGHLPTDGMLVVDEGTAQRAAGTSRDIEENEANAYARALLMPGFEVYTHPGHKAETLAAWVRGRTAGLRISPGVIVQNWGFMHKRWNVANAALKEFEADRDALAMMRLALDERLDWYSLSDEEADYLRRLTGLDSAD